MKRHKIYYSILILTVSSIALAEIYYKGSSNLQAFWWCVWSIIALINIGGTD